MNMPADTAVNEKKKWVKISDDLLEGKGMEPYNSEEMGQFIDWVERDDATASHAVPFLGQFLVDVVETDGNAVHLPNFPNDELIYIVTGNLTLTSDSTKVDQNFGPGDRAVVPKGWAGTWRVHRGMYREVAIVPSNYFELTSDTLAAPRDVHPFAVAPTDEAGTQQVYSGSFNVETRSASAKTAVPISQASDEVLLLVAGTLTLTTGDESESFAANDIVIIPAGFAGVIATSADYKAVVACGKAA